MTRTAVTDAFDEIAEDLYRYAREEVRPVKAVTGLTIPGADRIARSAAKNTIDTEMRDIRDEMLDQRDAVIAYTDARLADDPDAVERAQQHFLDTNPVYQRVSPRYRNRTDQLEDDLAAHLTTISDDFAPILASDEDEFWAAMTQTYDAEEARAVIDTHLDQVDAFKTYQDIIDIEIDLDLGMLGTKTVDVTDEAIRVLDEGKQRLQSRLYNELRDAYGEQVP